MLTGHRHGDAPLGIPGRLHVRRNDIRCGRPEARRSPSATKVALPNIRTAPNRRTAPSCPSVRAVRSPDTGSRIHGTLLSAAASSVVRVSFACAPRPFHSGRFGASAAALGRKQQHCAPPARRRRQQSRTSRTRAGSRDPAASRSAAAAGRRSTRPASNFATTLTRTTPVAPESSRAAASGIGAVPELASTRLNLRRTPGVRLQRIRVHVERRNSSAARRRRHLRDRLLLLREHDRTTDDEVAINAAHTSASRIVKPSSASEQRPAGAAPGPAPRAAGQRAARAGRPGTPRRRRTCRARGE